MLLPYRIQRWLIKRDWRQLFPQGCNFELAQLLLRQCFSGAVIRNRLADLLDAYAEKPYLDTALQLCLYDARLTTFFAWARRGGVADRILRNRLPRGCPMDNFPSDITPAEVDEARRQIAVEGYIALDQGQLSSRLRRLSHDLGLDPLLAIDADSLGQISAETDLMREVVLIAQDLAGGAHRGGEQRRDAGDS